MNLRLCGGSYDDGLVHEGLGKLGSQWNDTACGIPSHIVSDIGTVTADALTCILCAADSAANATTFGRAVWKSPVEAQADLPPRAVVGTKCLVQNDRRAHRNGTYVFTGKAWSRLFSRAPP